jgi:hypothetical protein
VDLVVKIDNDWTLNIVSDNKGRKLLVVNPHPFPVLATSEGFVLGGHKSALVFENDETVALALTARSLVKVYEVEGEQTSFVYEPKRKTKSRTSKKPSA